MYYFSLEVANSCSFNNSTTIVIITIILIILILKLILITIPEDLRLKEGEKIEKYQNLKREITRMWKSCCEKQVIPIIVSALDGVARKLGKCVGKLGITIRKPFLQKTALEQFSNDCRK